MFGCVLCLRSVLQSLFARSVLLSVTHSADNHMHKTHINNRRWGGYALYLFSSSEGRDAFVSSTPEALPIEPYIASGPQY